MIMSHNAHDMLYECIARLRKFTPFDFDLIIVDDASDTAYDIEDATIVRMPRRAGCCNLRNVGMEMAETDYVFWVDNDSFVGPEWTTQMIKVVENDPMVGLTGQPKDARLIRKPYLPLTQADCMIEYQFAYDFNHANGECDFITSYCVLVKKEAYRPAYSYGMPTPTLDPDLGAGVRVNGYKVKVTPNDIPVQHLGSATERPKGRGYLYDLKKNFTRWWEFWEPHKERIFELYIPGNEVIYQHDANEPMRSASRGQHGDLDLEPEEREALAKLRRQ